MQTELLHFTRNWRLDDLETALHIGNCSLGDHHEWKPRAAGINGGQTMRNAFYDAALSLKAGRDKALEGDKSGAVTSFDKCIRELKELPPERTRDVLLAHSYLAKYQTMALEDKSNRRAQESLHYGVSYARSTRDPLARAIAEECLSGLDIAL